MLIRTLALAALLLTALQLTACRSGGDGDAEHLPPVHVDEAPCVCGTPEGDLHGCMYEDCLLRVGNPENPGCFCASRTRGGDLAIGQTSTSFVQVSMQQSLESIRMLELADGSKVRGRLQSDDGQFVRFQKTGGDVEEYAREDLSPRSIYSLEKARIADDDGEGQLLLADLAQQCGLLSHARRHLQQAEKADPALADRVEEAFAALRAEAAEAQVQLAESAVAEGNLRTARREAGKAMREFGEEDWVITRAEVVLAQVDAAEGEAALAREDEDARKKLQPARDLVADARKKEQDGLKSGSRPGSAISKFESGVRSGESARKRVSRYLDEGEDNAALREGAGVVDRQAVEVLVDLNLHIASAELVRNSYNKALGAANAALALDPTDEAARDMRRRVEVASSQDRWGDGVVIGVGGGWRARGGLRR